MKRFITFLNVKMQTVFNLPTLSDQIECLIYLYSLNIIFFLKPIFLSFCVTTLPIRVVFVRLFHSYMYALYPIIIK